MDILSESLISQLFFGSIIVVAVAELVFPSRPLRCRLGPRWLANIGLGAANMLIARWLLPLSGAAMAAAGGIGLMNQLAVPAWAEIAVGVIALDVMNYWLHRAVHRSPLLWRLHRVHHSDMDVDFTSGVRHHPVEGILFMAATLLLVVTLGLSPLSILAYQAGRAVIDIVSHANVPVPAGLDRMLRWVIITPDMHLIHHSAWQPETDSNYGTLLSCWDRLFGSYRADPVGDLGLGLEEWRDEADLSIGGLMLMPFSDPPSRPAAPHPTPPPE